MMGRRFSVVAALLLVVSGIMSALVAEELTIIEDGKSAYAIVVPDGEDPRERIGLAAERLQHYLKEATGCELPIVKESALEAGKPGIYLGATKKCAEVGIDAASLHDWVYCKKIVDGNIFLVGHDASANITGPMQYHDREYLHQIAGLNQPTTLNQHIKDRSFKEWRGTYKAVLSFLDNEIGFRFLQPGENGRFIPELKKLAVDDQLDFLGAARFQYCYGRNYGDLETTIALNHNEIPYYKNYGGHSFPVSVPKRKYAESHPEYYVMVNGKRQPDYGPAGGGHVCISNPDVKELMYKEIEYQYNNGFKLIQVAQTDGQVPCSCPDCQEKGHGDFAEAQWIFFRELAELTKERLPEAKLVFLSYGLTKNPPQTFDSFPDNVLIELTIWSDFDKKFQVWERFKSVPKITYIYFFGEYQSFIFSPVRSPSYVVKNIRIMAENSVQGIYKCGWCISPGLEGPVCYVFSKTLEDPFNADPQKLCDDYYRHAFGNSYEPMKQFFDMMHKALDTFQGESVLDVTESRPRNPEHVHSFVYRPGLINSMEQLLSMAEKIDNRDPRVRSRLALVRREFDYLATRSRLYCYINAFNYSNAPEMLSIIERELANRDRIVNSWYDENGNMKLHEGIYFPFMHNFSKDIILYGGGQVPPPFPREIENGIEPLREMLVQKNKPEDTICEAEMIASAEDFFKTDLGDDAPAFGESVAPVKFKTAYDDKNLYILADCGFTNLKWGTGEVVAWAKSASCLDQEAVEVYLDVLNAREKHFRFIIHPKPDGGLAMRPGYDDPLNPAYGSSAPWDDTGWKYDIQVETEKHRFLTYITIPFEMLGISGAPKNATWNFNLVRRHFPYPPEFNDNRALVVQWSKSSASSDPTSPVHFGKMMFK